MDKKKNWENIYVYTGMQIIAGSQENYPAVNAIFPAVKHYFFLQNVFKCCQKIVIYLFHLFTPSNRGIACHKGTQEWAFGPNTCLSLQDSHLFKTLATSLLYLHVYGSLCHQIYFSQHQTAFNILILKSPVGVKELFFLFLCDLQAELDV